MRVKFVIRNKDKNKEPSFSKIFELPFLPPLGMVFSLPNIDEAIVDQHYGNLEKLGDNDVEVWLHVDEDAKVLADLGNNGWILEYAK